jgi:hypothetical protein
MLEKINELYKNYTGPVDNFNGLIIPFDPRWRRISLALSGGADSALLLYLLCKKILDTKAKIDIHLVCNIRCWKTRPWQGPVRDIVVDYFEKHFPEIHFTIHENFVPPELEHGFSGQNLTDEYGKTVSGDTMELRAWAEYVSFHNKVDAYFNAVTKNPEVNLHDYSLSARDVEPNEENFRLMVMNHLDILACHPFRFIDKSWVVLQYRILGIMRLFNLTRSCEGEFPELDYKTYVRGQHVPVCGECFWCKEREYAVEQSK